MTSPTMAFPSLLLTAPPANPLVGGLYGAATLTNVDDPAHLDAGTRIEQTNCGGGIQTWALGCDDDPDNPRNPTDKGEGDRNEPSFLDFPAFGVVATDYCGLVGRSEAEARTRAEQALRLREQFQVEEQFVAVLNAQSGTPATATSLAAAVGALETRLASLGVQGVIHAAPNLAAVAADAHLAVPGAAGKLTTPLGHLWAFGGGYGALGTKLVGTGPVTVYRTSPVTSVGVGHRQNERLVVAEREVSPTFECGAWAVTTN